MIYEKRFIKKYFLIIAIAIVGLSFACFSFLVLYDKERNSQALSYKLYAKNIISVIEIQLKYISSVLESLEAFYESSNYVDREEFKTYTKLVLWDKPSVKALQWIPKVYDAEKQSYIAKAKETGIADFSIKQLNSLGEWIPSADKKYYYPVYYSRPISSTAHLLGFDWSSIPARQKLLESINDHTPVFVNLTNIEGFSKYTYPLITPLFKYPYREHGSEYIKRTPLGFFVIFIDFDKLITEVLQQIKCNDAKVHIYIKRPLDKNYKEIYRNSSYKLNLENYKPNDLFCYKETFNWAANDFVFLIHRSEMSRCHINIYPALISLLLILALTFLLCFHLLKSMKKEDEIRRAVDERTLELKKSNEELDKFAYIASHDLKEPIRGIYSYANFLKTDYGTHLDAEANEMIDTIKDQCQRLSALISSLLEFSRLGRVDFAYKTTDLSAVVEDLKLSLKPYLEENNAKIILETKLPSMFCDSVRIGEVFRNLITNAVKYNLNESKTVSVGVQIRSDLGQVFYVKDNGIGIDVKHFDDVFQIFRRLNASSQFAEGTGVGLTLVKRIIERHGGKIWLESEKGKGTTFFFTLNVGETLENFDG